MMKKLLLLLTLLAALAAPSLATAADGTQPHLKFMGIPLDGTIASFQQKLQAKGMEYDPDSTELGNDTRAYNGSFSGHQAFVLVNFDPRTKIVYCAAAFIDRQSKQSADELTEDLASRIYSKYQEIELSDSSEEHHYIFDVFNSGSLTGVITVATVEIDGSYSVILNYYDAQNGSKASQSGYDDL